MSLKDKKKLLFIIGSTSLTGAPVVGAWLAKHIRNTAKSRIDVVFLKGRLSSELLNLIGSNKAYTSNILSGRPKFAPYIKLICIIISDFVAQLIKCIFTFQAPTKDNLNLYRAIYCNSLLTLDLGSKLKSLFRIPLVLHLHEMGFWINEVASHTCLQKNINNVDLIFAPSQLCINDLKKFVSLPPTVIQCIVPGPSNIHALSSAQNNEICLADDQLYSLMRRAINDGKYICISVGSDSWRKGIDHFINIAHFLNITHPDKFHFVWISPPFNSLEKPRIELEIQRLNISGSITFHTPLWNILDILKLSSCYLLTSREEPFGLSALDAMEVGTPVVCFEGVSGMSTFMIDSPEQLVPYPDIELFSSKVYNIVSNDSLKKLIERRQRRIVDACNLERFGDRVLRKMSILNIFG